MQNPPAVRSRRLPGVNGLDMHIREAGDESADRPLVLLLHGFPEMAHSWRRLLPGLAAAGFHAVAPDQRGYGETRGGDARFDGDVDSFRTLNLVDDAVAVVEALGRRSVAMLIGHDVGAVVAAWAALLRPEIFRAVVLMSAPFGGPPVVVPRQAFAAPPGAGGAEAVFDALERLPRPRKYYQRYFASRAADPDMRQAPQGLHAFLRAYFHVKSGDWPGNQPQPLAAATAEELAKMPTYYVMELNRTMPETVAPAMPDAEAIARCAWLPDHDLAVYAEAFARTGFQGGLQWYRCKQPRHINELAQYAGRTIDVPACFIAGRADWGVFQAPGALARMQESACTDFRGCHLLAGAGHWIQQERADEVLALVQGFAAGL